MTIHRPLIALSLLIYALALLLAMVLATSVTAAPPVQSCATPALTWATLVACRTETAAALAGTPTRTPSPQATPTRITPTETVVPSPTSRFVMICESDLRHCSTFRMPIIIGETIPTRTATP